MRIILSLTICAFLSLLYSCGGDGDPSEFEVKYEKESFDYQNLIHDEVIVADSNGIFGLSADLPSGAYIRVVLYNESDSLPQTISPEASGQFWFIDVPGNNGWYIGEYDLSNHTQTFYAEGPVQADVRLNFQGCGKGNLELYEFGARKPQKTKTFQWEICKP